MGKSIIKKGKIKLLPRSYGLSMAMLTTFFIQEVFLFLVMLVSIFLHFIFVLVPFYWVRLFGRLLMVPVVAGISFEIIQWAGRSDSKLADFFSKPGLAMQKLTTKEPTADMAEVAIRAVEAVFDWKAYLKEEFGVEAEQ